MGADLPFILRWWSVLFLFGAAAFPLTRRVFSSWHDRGYLFAKALGLALVTYFVFLFGTFRIFAFDPGSIMFSVLLTAGIGIAVFGFASHAGKGNGRRERAFAAIRDRIPLFVAEELFFLGALIAWSWVKAHEPSIRGLEKFMDYGFMQSALNARYFPVPDMWYAGGTINYYYFGHLATAVIAKLSGVPLAYGFNIMLASLFAFTLTMSWSLAVEVMRLYDAASAIAGRTHRLRMGIAGVVGAFLTTLGGNMQTIYAFTRGYDGDNVSPFWTLAWPAGEFVSNLSTGMNRYWYANATRFIPYTIHEFPSYSFVVSDVHGHVLSLPFVLLAIGVLIVLAYRWVPIAQWNFRWRTFMTLRHQRPAADSDPWGKLLTLVVFGFLVAVLLMTNALDGPIYFGLFLVLMCVLFFRFFRTDVSGYWPELVVPVVVVAVAAAWTAMPFLLHFKSFAEGIGVNCPPAPLALSRIGPILFEETTKCQKSPFWMMWLLWGFFWFTGLWLFIGKLWKTDRRDNPILWILKVFFLYGIVMIVIPEFLYVKDIYPQHFRSNTMFKLGYEAFIWWSLISGFVIAHMATAMRKGKRSLVRLVFFILLLPQLVLVSIYPLFSVRSYFGALRTYEGLDGLSWLRRDYPNDAAGIEWLRQAILQDIPRSPDASAQLPVIAEADGDSYTDYNRVSAFAGTPTVVGWAVHEWLWRGTYDVVAPRREEVRVLYTGDDTQSRDIILKYGISYVVVGSKEREKYPELAEEKFTRLGIPVFSQGDFTVYDVRGIWTGY